MRPLFTRFYRREAISRCIGLVRRIKIIFLPIRCRGFGLLLELGPRGAPKSAIWRRLSIDFCRIRAPMRGHRKMVCFSHISPHGRSKLDDAIGKQSRRSIDAKRSLSECSMDHPSTGRSKERWDRTFMVSVDTDDGAAHGAFGAVPGPKIREVPKKRTRWSVRF